MKDRRKQMLVHEFQYKMIGRFVLYGVIYLITFWNFLFFWRLIQEGSGNVFDQYRRFFLDYYPMLLCFLLLVPFLGWDVVRFTHRLVGPIYRFRQTLQVIAAGKPVRRVRLRAGDQLTEMRDDLNAMLQALSERGALTLIDAPRPADNSPSAVGSSNEAEDSSHVHPFPTQSA